MRCVVSCGTAIVSVALACCGCVTMRGMNVATRDVDHGVANAPCKGGSQYLLPVAKELKVRNCEFRDDVDLSTDILLRLRGAKIQVPVAMSEDAVSRMRSMLSDEERRSLDALLKFTRRMRDCDVYAIPRGGILAGD